MRLAFRFAPAFWLALATIAIPAAGQSPSQQSPPHSRGDSVASRVNAVADGYLKDWLAAFPDLPTYYGIPGARHDRLPDVSAAAEQAWQRREDHWIAALQAIDTSAVENRPEWVTYGLLREELESSSRYRVCRMRVWTVHPLFGWQADYAALAQLQPVGTADLRQQALTRWSGLPKLIDTEISNLREGVRAGYTEPKVNVQRVMTGMEKLLATPDTASPFFSPATRDTTREFRIAFRHLVSTEIVPALRRYRDYLANEYMPAAREVVSITDNPNGAACYRAAIRRFTTLDLSGEEIHDRGIREVAAAESAMRMVALQTFHTSDTRALMQRLRADTANAIASRDRVIPAVDSILARAWAAVPQWFGHQPRAKVSVKPFPEFEEASVAPGQYFNAAEDGSRPGIYFINLYLATKPGGRLALDDITFHEAVPGHHFQVSIGLERSGVHPLARYLDNSAFVEGWGIYSEGSLAREMGLYTSDATWLEELERRVYGFSTLVMETGMHVKGWSRQQAIDYELAHTTRSAEQAAIDVDRRIGALGQGLSYEIGYLEILRLRKEAEANLGTRFDIKAFHDHVLSDGGVTLSMLRRKIDRWLAASGQ